MVNGCTAWRGTVGGHKGDVLICGGKVDGAEDKAGFLVVARVQDTSKLIIAGEEGVGFINEEGGLNLGNDAEEGWGADVGGDDGVVSQLAKDGDEGGFAAAMFRGLKADVSGNVAVLKAKGMRDPEGEGFGGPPGEHDGAGNFQEDVVEELGAIDGLGPGLDGR